MLLIGILLGVFIVTAGVINYIFVVRNPNSSGGIFNFLGFEVSVMVTTLALIVINTLGVFIPQFVFTNIHWGWLLGISIVLLITIFIFVISAFNFYPSDAEETILGITGFMLIPLLVMLIIAPVRADIHTYELSEARDFRLLNNLPTDSKYIYHFEVTDDIDFEGEKTRLVYGREKFTYYIDGNGHTLSGFVCEDDIKEDCSLFTAGYIVLLNNEVYGSKISNITLDGFVLTVAPNGYDKENRIGLNLNYSIFDKDIELEGVTLNAEVIIADEVVYNRSLTPSTIASVLPESGEDDKGNKFNVTVTGELYKPEPEPEPETDAE